MNQAEIFFIGSSGIMFRCGDYMLMVDGIISDSNWFTRQTESTKRKIKDIFGGFNGKRILSFTHCHPDHYDDESVYEYLTEGSTDVLLVPDDQTYAKKCIAESEVRKEVIVVNDNLKNFNFGPVTLTYIKTRHVEYGGFENSNHYSILIETDGEKHLISGDIAPEGIEDLISMTGTDISTIFITPVLIGKTEWIKKFGELLPKTKFFIYHLPDDDMDQYGYKKMTKNKYGVCKEYIGSVVLLLNQMSAVEQ